MEFTFAADRKLVFFVTAGGLKRCVEFGDRNEAGASVFMTKDPKVAMAIRRHPLTRRGVITDTTPAAVVDELLQASAAPKAYDVRTSNANRGKASAGKTEAAPKKTVADDAGGSVREYENFTVAREAISKEFGIPKKNLRTPTALDRTARENGFTIRYKNAERQ